MQKLTELLDRSKAENAFKDAVLKFTKGEQPDRIAYSFGAPRIKVLRVIMKLLQEYPDTPIDRVEVKGRSSCSAFVGTLTFVPGNKRIKFDWDCSWKAKQEDMKTWYGMPDQTKAAQVFGYQCFREFRELAT